MPLARTLHTLGEFMIADDADDIGKTVYYDDFGHIYHGEVHPDHPGWFHHWMLGAGVIMISQIMGVCYIIKEMVMNHKTVQVDIDDIPLPGGKRLSKVIPIPYREAPSRHPALPDAQHNYDAIMNQLDAATKL